MGNIWLFVTSLFLFAFVSAECLKLDIPIIRKFITDVVTSCETHSIERKTSNASYCHPCNITNVQQYIDGVNFTSSDGVLQCSWKSYARPENVGNPHCTITSLNQVCSSLEGENVNHLIIQCPELLVFNGNLLTSNLETKMKIEDWLLLTPPNDNEIPNFIAKFAFYEMLFDINGTGLTNLSMFHNTTILTISSCRLNFQTLATMMKQLNLHNLEELHMENINYPMSSQKQFNVEDFHIFQNISYLSLAFSQYSKNDFSSEYLRLFPGISHFKMTNVNITALGWDNIIHWMPKLSYLTIDLDFMYAYIHQYEHFRKFIRTAIPWNDMSNTHHKELQVLITLPPIIALSKYEFIAYWNFSYLSLSDLSAFQFAAYKANSGTKFDLSHNELTMLIIQLDNTALDILDVSYNNITILQHSTCRLYGFGQLHTLVLSYNGITSINSPCFSQLSRLKDLHLDHNKISYLSRNSGFSKLSRLRKLYLNHNKISFISRDTFKGLLHGQYYEFKLYLSHNNLKQVPFSCFSQTFSDIYLSANPFTEDQGFGNKSYLERLFNMTPGDWQIPSQMLRDVKTKYKITAKSLKPTNSILEAVLLNFLFEFSNNPNNLFHWPYVTVYLSHLTMDSLGLDFFLHFTQQVVTDAIAITFYNTSIDLDIGALEYFKTTTNAWDYPNSIILDHVQLDIKSFELHCGCQDIYTYFILNSIYKGRSYQPVYYRDKWMCTSPVEVAGVPFLQIPQTFFKSCTENLENCPTNCACFHSINNMDRIIVDCTEIYFTELPSIVPDGTEVLHMPRSNLTSLCGRHKYMSKLIEIDVSGNHITAVCEDFVSALDATRLKHLNLQENDIQVLPQNMRGLENTTILLKGNKMACSCENTWLKYWLLTIDPLLIPDTTSLQCKNYENTYFLEIDDTILSDRCTDNTVSWLGLAIGSSVALALVLLAVALIYRFWKSIKVWCFDKFKLHPFDQGDMDDNIENMDYDVFISYSHLDLQWVRDNLMDFLQNQGYSVCLHEKDWPVGVLITENILLSVKHSRRMIMVLSENYLTSEWCRIEL